MRTLVAAFFVVAVAAMADRALAAGVLTAPSPLNADSWAGPYLGDAADYAWGKARNNPAPSAAFASGINAGYDWQHGQIAFGGAADITLSEAGPMFAPWGADFATGRRWSANADWLYLDLSEHSFEATSSSNELAARLEQFGVDNRL